MATFDVPQYSVVYLNSDGKFVGGFKAEFDAPMFFDYGTYLIPGQFYGDYGFPS